MELHIETLLDRINDVILNPLIVLLFFIAIGLFIFGLYELFISGENTDVRERSKRHMVWGIVGIAIMISVYGIISVLLNSFGINPEDPDGDGTSNYLSR